MQHFTPGPGVLTTPTSDDRERTSAGSPSLDGAQKPSPNVDENTAEPPGDDGLLRRTRRTLAQREAAARSDLATLAAERRRLRTRGAIVAGGVLLALIRARPALGAQVVQIVETLDDRDREAIQHFMPSMEVGA